MRNLSNRLLKISGLVPKSSRVADIGTDHGFLPVYLVNSGIAKSVLACDINIKPLLAAQNNIAASGAENIETRLSDGFAEINPDEIDTAVIAGIGGEVITGIIERCSWIKNSRYTLVLQPTTSPEKLREFLSRAGFAVKTEIAVQENGKLYSIMSVCFAGEPQHLTPAELYIGKLNPNSSAATAYIKKQLNRLNRLSNDIKYIPEKQAEYAYFSGITSTLSQLLGGK